MITNEQQLNYALSEPSAALIARMKEIDGDIMILGAGGKVGPSLAVMAKKAAEAAKTNQRVYAVSRFTDPYVIEFLREEGVEMISADLTDEEQIKALPKVKNIIFALGRKFGTGKEACETWQINVGVPALVTRHFGDANYVVFSTGNVYPMRTPEEGGCDEHTAPAPVGEYAMTSLGRERIFEYAAKHYGAKVLLFRLNYAVDLRYGVLYDIAERIWNDQPVTLHVPAFNCVWQRYVNEAAIGALTMASADVERLNVTGPEQYSTREAAEKLAAALGKPVTFLDDEGTCGLLSCADKCVKAFGMPDKTVDEMIVMQAEWMKSGGRQLDKPTHFQETKGNF